MWSVVVWWLADDRLPSLPPRRQAAVERYAPCHQPASPAPSRCRLLSWRSRRCARHSRLMGCVVAFLWCDAARPVHRSSWPASPRGCGHVLCPERSRCWASPCVQSVHGRSDSAGRRKFSYTQIRLWPSSSGAVKHENRVCSSGWSLRHLVCPRVLASLISPLIRVQFLPWLVLC